MSRAAPRLRAQCLHPNETLIYVRRCRVLHRNSGFLRAVLLLVLVTMPLEAVLSASHGVFCVAKSHHAGESRHEAVADPYWSEHSLLGTAPHTTDRACCCHLPLSAVTSAPLDKIAASPQFVAIALFGKPSHFAEPPRRPPKPFL